MTQPFHSSLLTCHLSPRSSQTAHVQTSSLFSCTRSHFQTARMTSDFRLGNRRRSRFTSRKCGRERFTPSNPSCFLCLSPFLDDTSLCQPSFPFSYFVPLSRNYTSGGARRTPSPSISSPLPTPLRLRFTANVRAKETLKFFASPKDFWIVLLTQSSRRAQSFPCLLCRAQQRGQTKRRQQPAASCVTGNRFVSSTKRHVTA